MAIVEKGDKIPGFKLLDQNNELVDSDEIEGKILLAFHPLAWTSLCLDQMRDLENAYGDFKDRGVTPIGVSVDPAPTKAVWAKGIGLTNLQIVADFNPLGQLAKDCGVFLEDSNTSGRANVLIEGNEVLWSKNYDLGTRPDLDEILKAIDQL